MLEPISPLLFLIVGALAGVPRGSGPRVCGAQVSVLQAPGRQDGVEVPALPLPHGPITAPCGQRGPLVPF